jgi:site-specific DNA-methyltransferase (adenine-specific)
MHLLARANAMRLPLADRSVHCVVTSPPYYQVRDYRVADQIGLEETVDEYLTRLRVTFREVYRVLRDDGTLWLNIGSSYDDQKRLLLIPYELAKVLETDGWILRAENIWQKPNPMPESVQDRTTRSHEHVFHFAKRGDYYYDAEAIAEPAVTAGEAIHTAGGWETGEAPHTAIARNGRGATEDNGDVQPPTRNRRSVWTIAPQGYKGAHFATFPPKLVEICIKAGTSERGCCSRCGAPWQRVALRDRVPTRPGNNSKVYVDPVGSPYLTHSGSVVGNRDPKRHVTTTTTVGWEPTCACGADVARSVVYDPFAGAGTTLVAAEALGRHGIGSDLKAEYLEMAQRRILRPHARIVTPKTEPDRPLFAGLDD